MRSCISMSKVCLVLEGGGNRGVYTSGVLDAFLDNNIDIKTVYGVSAGALNALSYLSKQKGRSFNINKEFVTGNKCINYKRIFVGNIVSLDYLFEGNETVEEFNLEEFNKREKFVVTCSDIVTGNALYKTIENYDKDLPYIKASASLPLFSKIVEVDSYKLLDGGICDSIPALKALQDGYDKIIVILTRHKEYVAKPYKFMSLYMTKYIKYPNLIRAMETRCEKYNVTRDAIENLEKEGKMLAVYPSEELVISRLEKDVNKLEEIYNIGYKDGINMIEKIKEYIGGLKVEKKCKTR